jgi:hypothetical protein
MAEASNVAEMSTPPLETAFKPLANTKATL